MYNTHLQPLVAGFAAGSDASFSFAFMRINLLLLLLMASGAGKNMMTGGRKKLQSKGSMVMLAFLLFENAAASAQSPGTFTPTGSMTIARRGYTATLLPSGKVLFAGGNTAAAELYDPATGTFTRTGGMTTPRSNHSATLLPDGKVLIAGGSSPSPSSAELYDPSTGTFSSIGDMLQAGAGAAILLANGTVLIAHDVGIGEIYDPVAGTFSATGYELAYPGGRQQGALLADGRALLLICCRAQQLYDPESGTFSLTGTMTGIDEDGFASALPPAGKVLVTGGYDEDFGRVSAGACLYDSATGTFAATGNMNSPRYYHTATTLGDGTVLIAGGYVGLTSAFVTASAEIYDRAAGTFVPTGNMTQVRVNHTATLLPEGTVLIADGSTSPAEIYHPVQPVSAPALFSLGGDAQGQGAIWHATTGQVTSAGSPASAGELLSMYTTSLSEGGVVPPQVSVGGRLAEILYFGEAPGYPGYFQVNFRVPDGVSPGAAAPVHLTYLGRPSNEVTIAVQ
jgi:uncharacterized protein (TIGR03437 family)